MEGATGYFSWLWTSKKMIGRIGFSKGEMFVGPTGVQWEWPTETSSCIELHLWQHGFLEEDLSEEECSEDYSSVYSLRDFRFSLKFVLRHSAEQ
jgi:hypothetical protein